MLAQLALCAAVRDVWPKTREQRDWFHRREAKRRGLGDQTVINEVLPKAAA